jgi:hypothetical protein
MVETEVSLHGSLSIAECDGRGRVKLQGRGPGFCDDRVAVAKKKAVIIDMPERELALERRRHT